MLSDEPIVNLIFSYQDIDKVDITEYCPFCNKREVSDTLAIQTGEMVFNLCCEECYAKV